jgi:hypothetical protein
MNRRSFALWFSIFSLAVALASLTYSVSVYLLVAR